MRINTFEKPGDDLRQPASEKGNKEENDQHRGKYDNITGYRVQTDIIKLGR